MMSIKNISLLLLTSIVGLFLFFPHTPRVLAANACVSSGAGNWNTTSTWTGCGGGVPTLLDSVTILTGHIVTVDTAAVADTVTINANTAAGGNGITISSGQSLTVTGAVTLAIPTAATTDLNVDGGSLTAGSIAIPGGPANRFATVSVSTGIVTVTGSITFSGTAARARYTSTGASMTKVGGDFGSGGLLTTSGTGTFNFNGSGAQVIGAYTTYNNVEINNTGGGVTFGGTTTIGGTLLVNTGTLDIGGISPTVAGATTINSTLVVSSVTGSKTFGDITIASGGTMSFTAAEAVTMNGNLAVNGTGAIVASTTTGTWTFQKSGGGTISGTASSVALNAGTFTTNYVLSIPGIILTVTVNGTSTTLTNNTTLTANTALSGTGQLTQGSGSILNLGGTSGITALDASASANEVHYISTAANQTIKTPTSAYHHLFIEKSGRVATLAAATTINGNLSVVAGSLADGGFQITGNPTGVFTLATSTTLTLGTTATATTATTFPTGFTAPHITLSSTSTVNYNFTPAVSGGQTISNVPTYGNLTTTATAAVTKTAEGAITVNGVFTNGTNNGFADGGFTITLKDGCTMTGAHTGTGKILFTGGSAVHSISGTYSNVELNDTNGVLLSGTTAITGTLIITSGTFDADARTITVTATTTINGTLLVSSTSGTKTFGTIVIGSGGSLSFSAAEAMTINGDVTVNGAGTISGTSGTWTFQKVGGGTIGGTTSLLTILGSLTFATPYAILVPFVVNTMTVSAGVNEMNLGTMTINTALAGATGTFTQSTGTVLNLGGSATIGTLDASSSQNEVHYTSVAASQTVKAGTYYHLFLDKSGQQATMNGTTNVLGNLVLSAGTMSIGASTLTITGTTDIYGSLKDLNNTGSTTFGGLVTVHSGGSWDCIPTEDAPFSFSNGLVFNGGNFVSSPGLYTFQNNNQSIAGSSAVTIDAMVVTGIQVTNNNASSVTISTTLSGSGEFIQGANAVLNIMGTSTVATLTATAAGNNVNYVGAFPQILQPGVYQNLDVSGNTTSSIGITATTTVDAALILGSTMLATGSSTLVMGPGATLSRTTGFVSGVLEKNVSTGSPSRTFEVGSGIDYTPVQLNFNAVAVSGDVSVGTTPTDHAIIADSNLIADRTVNRFYTVTNRGASFSSSEATFTFLPTDVDAGADTANFVVAKFDSGTWSRPTISTITTTSISVTGMTSFSEFQIGEPSSQSVTVPPSLGSGGGGGGTGFGDFGTIIEGDLSLTSLSQNHAIIPSIPDTGLPITSTQPPQKVSVVGENRGQASVSTFIEKPALFDVIAQAIQSTPRSTILFIIGSIIAEVSLICLLILCIRRIRVYVRARNIEKIQIGKTKKK